MKRNLINISIAIVISVATVILFKVFSNDKMAYVRTGVVLEKYQGMISTNEKFNKEVEMVRANIDTLKKRYENIKLQENIIPKNKKIEWEYKLKAIENEYNSYNQKSNEQMQKRQMELSNAVLSEINEFIISYGKAHHYKYILGTTNDGSILYGNDSDDITEEIIKELNKKHQENKPVEKK